MARSSSSSRVLTDHEEIRNWAEERGAKPTCVKGTGGGGDTGMIRLDFPGYSGEKSLQPIDWDDWFQKFDENNLALLVQDETAKGEKSNFNKIIGRDTAEHRARGERASRHHGGNRGSESRSASDTASRRRGTSGSRQRRGTSSRSRTGSSSSAGTGRRARSSRTAEGSRGGRRKTTPARSTRKTTSSSGGQRKGMRTIKGSGGRSGRSTGRGSRAA